MLDNTPYKDDELKESYSRAIDAVSSGEAPIAVRRWGHWTLRLHATIDALTARAAHSAQEIHEAKCALSDAGIEHSGKTLVEMVKALAERGRHDTQMIVEAVIQRRGAEQRAEQAELQLRDAIHERAVLGDAVLDWQKRAEQAEKERAEARQELFNRVTAMRIQIQDWIDDGVSRADMQAFLDEEGLHDAWEKTVKAFLKEGMSSF